MIIHSTILRMFNPNHMRRSTAPLSAAQFTDYVLIPHVACKLIEEDLSCTTVDAFQAMLKSSDVGISLYPADDEDDEDDEELDNAIISNMRNSRATRARLSPPPGFQLVVVDRPSDSTTAPAGSTRPKPKQLKMVPLADEVPFMLQVAGHGHASLTCSLRCSMPLDPLRIRRRPGKPDRSHNRSYSHPSTGHASLTCSLRCSMPLDPLRIRRRPGKPDRSHNALVEVRLWIGLCKDKIV
jgi:hypothetical protein